MVKSHGLFPSELTISLVKNILKSKGCIQSVLKGSISKEDHSKDKPRAVQ